MPTNPTDPRPIILPIDRAPRDIIDPQIASAATFHLDHRTPRRSSPDRGYEMESRRSLNLSSASPAYLPRRASDPERPTPSPSKDDSYSHTNYHCDPNKLEEFDFDQLVSYLDRPASPTFKHEHKTRKLQDHFFWNESLGTVKARTFNEFDFKPICKDTRQMLEQEPFWINFCGPTPEEMNSIARAFGLHPLTNEDIQTPDTREKCKYRSGF